MIESKARDSGGFNQNAESTTAAPTVDGEPDFSPSEDPLLNTVFAEKYLILERLGAGGMSVVYLARHEALDKLFAIKTLHTHLMSKTTSLMRFKQEAQSASRLQHPGIVAMHDYGVAEDGTPYLVMDYVEGESLADLLLKVKSLPPSQALDIFEQTTAAIGHAHHRGIIHRDIKPSNIMLHFDERHKLQVKIVDFGVAKFIETADDAKLTQTGEALGSPLYMSPEQCLGQALDQRSDIYSLGCVMYETLTGAPPLVSDGVLKTMMKHIHDMPAGFKEVSPHMANTDGLERIVFKSLAKDPNTRYQKLDEMLADLQALGDESGLAQKIAHKYELTKLKQTTRTRYIIASVLCAVIAATGWVTFAAYNHLQTLNAVPNFNEKGATWQPYTDKPYVISRNKRGEDMSMVFSSMQNFVIEAGEEAVKKSTVFDEKVFELAFNQREKAADERRQHQYDAAIADYDAAITYLERFTPRAQGILHANATDNLFLAYIGKADCEYFKPNPNYPAASVAYRNGIEVLRGLKSSLAWTQLPSTEQLEMFLRNADSYFMQGKYERASTERLLIPELMRTADRQLTDASYTTLTASKVAEEAFRMNKLAESKKLYKTVLSDWTKAGDNYFREQAIATARLAEISMLQNSSDQNEYFEKFERIAETIENDEPKLLRFPVFANAFQAYSSYLCKHANFAKANQMHERAVKYGKQS